MGQVSPFQDPTGQMTPQQINAKNIILLTQEFNRSQDLLDSLNQTLKIINKGKLTGTWDGTFNAAPTAGLLELTTSFNATTPYTFFAYYDKSDEPGKIFTVPNLVIDTNYNIIYEVTGDSVVNGSVNTLAVDFSFYKTGLPTIFNVYYFIFQQPANITQS